jgi:hypothetical protein
MIQLGVGSLNLTTHFAVLIKDMQIGSTLVLVLDGTESLEATVSKTNIYRR